MVEVPQPLSVLTLLLQVRGLWHPGSRVGFSHLHHHEPHTVSEASMQVVQTGCRAGSHRTGIRPEHEERRCGLSQVDRSEPAFAQGGQIEFGDRVAGPGSALRKIHVAQNEPNSEMIKSVAARVAHSAVIRVPPRTLSSASRYSHTASTNVPCDQVSGVAPTGSPVSQSICSARTPLGRA